MIICSLSVIIILLLVIIIMSLYGFMRIEHFTHVGGDMLSPLVYDELNQNNAIRNNTPCTIPTSDGNKFQFKVADTQLEWFAIPGQSQICSLDLGSPDVDNIPSNCSKDNQVLYDPNVIDEVYWNDLPDVKRCEVKFKENLNTPQMMSYFEKQRSFKTVTECKQAIRDAHILGEEKKKLQADLAASLAREEADRQVIAQKQQQIENTTAALNSIKQQQADAEAAYNAAQNQMASIMSNSQNKAAQISQLEALRSGVSPKEKALIDERIQTLRALIADDEDKMLLHKANASLADEQRRHLEDVASAHSERIASYETKISSINASLQTNSNERARLNEVIATHNATISALKSTPPPAPVPPPPAEQPVTGGNLVTSPNFIPDENCIKSSKGHSFCAQSDANIVMYNSSKQPKWASGTFKKASPPIKLAMQNDGNLVAYDRNNAPFWASGTYGKGRPPYRLVAQDDGNVVIYDGNNSAIWATGTLDPPPPPPPAQKSNSCNYNACRGIISSYLSKKWSYDSSKFGECVGCPVVKYPNTI